MLKYTRNTKGYSPKYGFYAGENLSHLEVDSHALQLEPKLPKASNLNYHIRHSNRII